MTQIKAIFDSQARINSRQSEINQININSNELLRKMITQLRNDIQEENKALSDIVRKQNEIIENLSNRVAELEGMNGPIKFP